MTSFLIMPDSPLSYPPEQTRYEHPRIVGAAQELFLQRGIEAVALTDIALSLRMPLGAIERHFPEGKPALVQVVVQERLRYVHDNLTQLHLDSSNAVEELLAMRRFLQQMISDTGALFFHELQAHYPSTWRYFTRVRTEFTAGYMQANFRRGMAEGLYRPELDVVALAQQWLEQVERQQATAHTPAELADRRYAHVGRFLAGLTTPVGAYVMQRLQEAPPYY